MEYFLTFESLNRNLKCRCVPHRGGTSVPVDVALGGCEQDGTDATTFLLLLFCFNIVYDFVLLFLYYCMLNHIYINEKNNSGTVCIIMQLFNRFCLYYFELYL